ncbi:unnamed protein product [Paramecium octaurelia]|uniref:RING-type domain-containing protein n=1 Tax=Paramecium octaurelia TaxID=43137 RepID=A0A8S1UUN1_PAROT|nr:unnamed protein product [Paramecium octaurelia]
MTDQISLFDENDEDLVADYGFESQEQEEKNTFQLKPFQIADFPLDQNLISFAINDHCIVFTTDRKKIYRWRFLNEDGCVELPIKTEVEGDITDQIMKLSGQVSKQIGGAVLNTVSKVTKPLFNASMKRSKRMDSEEGKLDCIFLEPKGNHIIVTSNKGDVYHACKDEEEVRLLEGVENFSIRFFLWGEGSLYSFQNSIIIASNNKIYTYSLNYNNDKLLHTEVLSKSILQIPEIEKIVDVKKVVKNTIHMILIVTDKHIYILNGTKDLRKLFQKYQEAPDLFLKSRIALKDKSYIPRIFIENSAILWTNGNNILLSNYSMLIENQTFQNSKKLKNYKRTSTEEVKLEQLYGIGLTKYHYYLLTFDTLTIINLLSMTVVAYFDININTSGKALGMLYDQGTECFWVWCTNGIFRISVEFEDKDAWEQLLEQKSYEEALLVNKKYDSSFYGQISGKYADILFNQALQLDPYKTPNNENIQNDISDNTFMRNRHNRSNMRESLFDDKVEKVHISTEIVDMKFELYRKAALYYFGSNRSYEQVILQYEMGEINYNRDGLIENYLKPMVDLLDKELKQIVFKKILELLMLSITNQGSIKAFLEQYKTDLEVDSVIPTLKVHGLTYLETYFIELKQDHKTVVQNLLIQEDYRSVQEKLSSLNDNDLLINLVYKYSYVIMKYNTQQTLDLFKKIDALDAQKMLSILLDVPLKSKELAIQFMQYCIFVKSRKITDINFNNLYLQYLADLGKVEQIMYYINEQINQNENGEKIKFDLNYASQLFVKTNLLQPYVYILQMLGDYENAIKKAIEIDLIEDAKNIALKCDDNNKQRQLWILQIRLMLEKGGKYVKQIVQLTREIPLIKAEDILPYLTQNIKLDDFKDEICETLEEYHDQVEKQQNELEGYIKSNENLKKLLLQTSNRYIFVSQKNKCENCFRKLFQEDYIVFECSHGFHRECILQYIKSNPTVLDQKTYHSMLYLEKQLNDIEKLQIQTNQTKPDESIFGFFTASNQITLNNQRNARNEQQKKFQSELNEILSKDCPVCGNFIFDQILLPLDNDEYTEETWFI